MKKLILLLLISFGLNAQFNYQAIVRHSSGQVITNNVVNFKFSLMYQSANSSPFYVNEQSSNSFFVTINGIEFNVIQ